MCKKLTTDEFILKSINIYGDIFDYSLTDYKGSKIETKIVCKICGHVMYRTPHYHLSKVGCAGCNGTARSTSEKFIERSKIIHFDKNYDYTKVNYINNISKIIVGCKIHGDFKISPKKHLMGHGCRKCKGFEKDNETIKKEFLEIHGNTYDYSKVDYKGSKSKIIVTCKTHGDFITTPNDHLNGGGCKKCCYEKLSLDFREKNIVERFKEIHGDKYNYNLVNYVNMWTPVIINCKVHGEFLQTPQSHLRYSGCHKCRSSKGELKIINFLKKHDILYDYQKKFKDCKNKYSLPFDFYIPVLNTCIEFDGQQHDIIVERWGGEEGLKIRKERDKIKTEYCKTNNIRLIRISYDENIEEKLKQII